MVKVSIMPTTYVDREEASKLLNVSTRTVDRCIRKFRFNVKKDGRKVLIKRIDLNKIAEKQAEPFMQINQEVKSDQEVKVPATEIAVKNLQIESVRKAEKEETVFQNLYQETKKELKEKQERLDAATYRVGQLESKLENT